MKSVVIVDGARTPMAEYNGHFTDISAIELGAIAAKEALQRSGFAPDEIDHVIVGNALQTSSDAIYGARHVGLKAGVPKEVPALTVNRLCGSGIQSIINAAQQIQLGEADTVLAGGMENMSQAPHVIRGARKGFKLGQGQIEDSLMVALLDSYCGLYMAQTAENLARKYNITREEQDQFAFKSQKCATEAADKLKDEIDCELPVPDPQLLKYIPAKEQLLVNDRGDEDRDQFTPRHAVSAAVTQWRCGEDHEVGHCNQENAAGESKHQFPGRDARRHEQSQAPLPTLEDRDRGRGRDRGADERNPLKPRDTEEGPDEKCGKIKRKEQRKRSGLS